MKKPRSMLAAALAAAATMSACNSTPGPKLNMTYEAALQDARERDTELLADRHFVITGVREAFAHGRRVCWTGKQTQNGKTYDAIACVENDRADAAHIKSIERVNPAPSK